MTPDPNGDRHVVNVDRIVNELRARVARQRASGAYGDDLTGIDLELAADEAPVRFRPELAYSTKPGLGRPLTFLKRGILRLLIHVFDDLARQTSAAVQRSSAAVQRLEAEGRETRRWSEAALAAEVQARSRVERDLQSLLGRIETLEHLEAGVRIARLERSRSRLAPPAAISGTPAALAAPAAAPPPGGSELPMDYPAFKARFGGSSQEIRARQESYLDALRGRTRVVDLGCGHGELLSLLAEHGVSAYGVETEPDFVERLGEKGLEVVEADALAHLAGLAPAAVDGVVASHVVEHLPPAVMIRLIEMAHDALAPGGVLVMETPNPESLVAGSVNFHRDPTHLSPVHPDTLVFLCEMAGYARVEVRRLSPTPAARMLPTGAGDGALAERLDTVVGRLNDLLYGYQDYAVLAWR